MHQSIQVLSNELLSLIATSTSSFTQANRDKLMDVKKRIKKLGDNDGVTLDSQDESDRQFLYVTATQIANQQEEFYEKNGNKWAS